MFCRSTVFVGNGHKFVFHAPEIYKERNMYDIMPVHVVILAGDLSCVVFLLFVIKFGR